VDGNGSYLLAYGDPALAAPRYDYATLFAVQPNAAAIALLGAIALRTAKPAAPPPK
jgi:hypothetical protein